MSSTPDPYIKTAEAAAYLGHSVRTLEKWRTTGDGPPFYKLGSSVRYRRSDLDEWARGRACASTSEF